MRIFTSCRECFDGKSDNAVKPAGTQPSFLRRKGLGMLSMFLCVTLLAAPVQAAAAAITAGGNLSGKTGSAAVSAESEGSTFAQTDSFVEEDRTASAQAATTTIRGSTASSLKVTGFTRPTTLIKGSFFNVRGAVSSNHRIKKITVSILNAKKKVISTRTVRPYTYKYNLANIDEYILFNKADTGTNYYQIKIKDSRQTVTKRWAFSVTTVSKSSAAANFIGYAKYTGVNYRKQTSDSRRIAALDKARKMTTIKWKCGATFPAWYNIEGYYSKAKATDGTTSTKFKKGKTYIGIPYSMANHSYDDNAWKNLVQNGYTSSQMSAAYYSYTNRTTAKGSDCSYFVYLCMLAGGARVTYQTTYMMYNGRYYKKISKSSLKPGDILLSYEHVRLYAGRVGSRYAVFESTADGSKTRYALFTAKQLKGYGAYRYKNW